jgi:hypothetical protein
MIAPDQTANLVVFRFKEEFMVEKTILLGEEVFRETSRGSLETIPNPL